MIDIKFQILINPLKMFNCFAFQFILLMLIMKIKFIKVIALQNYLLPMLMDPRPYTYEYRKPRFSNPTFQSTHLYDSLYHQQNKSPNQYFNHPKNRYQSSDKLINKQAAGNLQPVIRKSSQSMQLIKPKEMPSRNIDALDKYQSSYELPALNKVINKARAQSQIGNIQYKVNPELNSKQPYRRRQGFQRFSIYERQQKPFNIISCYPKNSESNMLRNYPKLTLQNGLIEKGTYHDFKSERF